MFVSAIIPLGPKTLSSLKAGCATFDESRVLVFTRVAFGRHRSNSIVTRSEVPFLTVSRALEQGSGGTMSKLASEKPLFP